MDVTKANFREILPEVTNNINEASFLCLDGEFTGLNSGDGVTAFDTPSEYYNKLRDGAMNFLLFQFGLVAFKYDTEKRKYTHSAYNFYLFPRPHSKNVKDVVFTCQSSCLDFLSKQNFDFNKVFKDGIPYLRDEDEQCLREYLQEKREKEQNPKDDSIRIPDDLRSHVENACQQVKEFLESQKAEQELILDKNNAFIRRLIYQEVRNRFSRDEVTVEFRNYTMIAIRLDGSKARERLEAERRDRDESDLEDAVGFTAVMRALSKSGKLIVGHNLLLDLLHVIGQFYVPLPDTYEDFKELVHHLFPSILDTKYLCVVPPFRDMLTTSALVNLVRVLKEPPFTMPDVDCEEGKGYTSVDLKYHEAGFDAYMTGLVYLSLGHFLVKSRSPFAVKQPVNVTESNYIKPYINRIHLMRVQDTHIFFGGSDPVPQRDHVYLVTFPKEWKIQNINQLFGPYGSIFASWINETSAWVSLHHPEQMVNVRSGLLKNVPMSNVTVTPYCDLKRTGNTLNPKKFASPAGFSSPATSAARKRRDVGVDNEDSSNKRRKRESHGKKRNSISEIMREAIPEEVEESPANEKNKCSKVCMDALSKDKVQSCSKKKLEFEENDSWD